MEGGAVKKSLKIDTIKKMVQRFLLEKRMTKERLADILGVTIKGLEQLFSQKTTSGLISKIELPLIKLYCKTPWA